MSGRLTIAVNDALLRARLRGEDVAGEALACEYARLIDETPTRETLSDLGPKLLATLTALGLTPAGRTTRTPEGGARDEPGAANGPAGVLADLRSRARARTNGAAPVDTAAS